MARRPGHGGKVRNPPLLPKKPSPQMPVVERGGGRCSDVDVPGDTQRVGSGGLDPPPRSIPSLFQSLRVEGKTATL